MLDEIVRRGVKAPFMAQISIEAASDERLLERLRKAGATLFEIGFESLNIKNLEYINKNCRHEIRASTLSVEEFYSKRIAAIQAHGISIQGSFILGLPYDHFNSIDDNTGAEIGRFCAENRISLMAGCFCAQPGARTFAECLEAGTFLYGAPDTMSYLRTLCVADHTEMNIVPGEGLRGSPLLAAIMALVALRRASGTGSAFRTAWHMARRSFAHPTARGKASSGERLRDAAHAFLSELFTCALYRDIGERLATTRHGMPGIVARLYRAERDPFVRYICEKYLPQLL